MGDFPSTIDLSSPGTDGDAIRGGAAGDLAGWSVASAGDVDGDGLCDFLIGAPSDGSGSGRVWLIFGRASGIGTLDLGALSPDRGFVITGAAPGDVAGWSVAAAGDLNHDGKADFVIGARLADPGGAEDAGRAYVIFGAARPSGPIDLAALAPGRGFAIDSGAGFDHAGWSVAAAGDFNHDGIDDLLIGVPGADGAGADRGAAFVLFGHDGGFGDVDLAALTPAGGFAITGGADYDEAGRSLAAAGDVNGDGFDDILVGAAHAGGYAGAAYVVFGQAGGPGAIDLGALTTSQGFAILGAGGEQAGFSVAGAGDVNGDGFDDLIVGAPYAEDGAGRAYVVFGHGGPFASVDLAGLTQAQGFIIAGAAAGDHSGWSVAGGGDLDGDGFDDLIIGAPYADHGGGTDRGAAYVIFGHNGTFEAIDLGAIPAGQGLAIQGESDYDQAGRSVAFSGDINNDGLDDLLVGAPYSGAGDSGGAYIIYGKSGTMTTTKHSLASGNFSQNWSNTGLITVNDDWSGVPSIVGYRTGDVTAATGVDARTITTDTGFVVNVIANAASTNQSGGVLEVETGAALGSPVNPTIGMAGANGNDYAAIVIYLDTSSRQDVRLTANIRDLDVSADNAIQQVVVQYRVGSSGVWTNVTGGYFADVTTANSATQVTAVDLTLPADANNQPEVQIRILTTNAAGNDELIGIDDIGVSSNPFVGVENQTVQFNPTSVTHAEGDSGATTYTFTVTRTGGTTGQLNFSGTIAAGSTDNADYVGGTAPTTFNGSIAAGQTSATVIVNIQGDYTIEPNEAFTLTLTSVSNTDLSISSNIGANLTGTGNITNDDAAGIITVANVSITEGDSGTTPGSFIVTRSGGATGTVTVDYTITLPGGVGGADGTDVSGPLTGTVTFLEGETSKTIPFTVNGDTTIEPDETFTVALSNATGGATIGGTGSATATIVNDDPPSITIGDASIVEGDNGVTYLVFTVSLSKVSGDPITVDYDTAGVTATEDTDYLGVTGQLSFAPGETVHTISVPIIGDEVTENNETLTVTLSSPTNATILDGSATGTITNDDTGYYSLAGGSFSQNWTNTGQITADDNWSGVPYIVGYLGDIDPSGSTTNVDPRILTGANLGAVDVIANQTGTGISNGGVAEFHIANPTVGLQGSGTADAPSIVLYMDSTGRSGVRVQANLRDIDGTADDSAQQINVQYRTSPGGAWINVPGGYFPDVTSGPSLATQVTALDVTLPAGADNAATLEIRIMTTNAGGNDEWVGIDDIVVSSQSSGAVLSVANAAVFEGDSGPTLITFIVTRAGSSAGAATADYAVSFGGGPFDANAADFTGPLSGQVSFADGETEAEITLSVNGDTGPEGDENFTVTLSNPSAGATIADGSATGTIVNDDGPPPLVSINNVTVTEGDSGTALMTFTITRTGGTGAFDVDWQTGDLTATDPEDYLGNSGTIHFANGQMTDTITVAVTINGDTDSELSETFQVTLSNPTNFAVVVDDTGIGTIASDDPIFIHDIQGTAYFSPILTAEGITSFNTASAGTVIVRAIVTAVDNDGPRQGFYLQEEIADWDGNSFTSEGIFVFTGSSVSGVAVGDLVTVTAHVMEYQGFASNMPVTTLTSPSSIVVNSSANPLPTFVLDSSVAMPTAIMTLVQPDYTDSSDGVGDTFDASLYALSFWETVEGMLVTIPNMVVADGFVATSGGQPIFQAYSTDHADADQINARGGYTIAGDPPVGPPDTAGTEDDTISGGRHLSDGDVNPDIIEVDFSGFAIDAPAGLAANASMGDYLGSITGIVEFDFTDRKLFVTDINSGSFVNHTTTQDVTVLGDDSRSLTVATFNVENLDPNDAPSKFAGLAAAIANNLNMPDIISIEEMQDNNGALAGDGIDDDPITPGMQDTGGTDASITWQMLVDALNTLTGAHYQWVDEAPVYNAEGGEQSGNIRVGFLYNTDRVQLGDLAANASLADRRMYTDRIGDGVRDAGDLIQFSDNMLGGEIQTSDWSNTRKSLLGQFTFNGNTVFVTANHFPAKGGSDDFWEFNQNPAAGEPTNAGWTQRNAVAQDVYSMLNLIQTNAPGSGIVSGGDYNDFYFYRPLTTVTGYTLADGTARVGGARFDNLTLTLTEAERYTYNFDGRSQAIDHIIVNESLSAVANYDIVHLNTGFNSSDSTPLSDHDPGLASFDFRSFSETLIADAGNDAIDGFGGIDTVVYGGVATIVQSIGGWTVDDGSGTDTLTNVEIVDDSAPGVILLVGNGGFATIQDAIDAASDGDTIMVASGTYNENLTVDKDVTIEGANAGTPGTGSRGAETVINGQITVTAAGVTIDGVRLIGSGPGTLGTTAVVVEGGANDFSLVNSVLDGTGYLGVIVGGVTGLDVGDNLIEGYSIGMYVSGGGTTGSIHDNRFQGDGPGSGTGLVDGLNSETTHVTISGNIFDGIDGGSLFLFPSGPDTVDLDSYVTGNTFSDSGADRPIQILPTNLTHNVIGTDFNEAFDGETAALDPLLGGGGVTGSFSFDGQGGDDRAWGGGEIDTFTGGAGDDWLFGNAGDDNAIYSGNRSDYTVILLSPGVIQITDDRPSSPDGTDRLEGVERIVFANNDYWVEADGTLSVINDAPLGVDHSFTILEDEVRVLTVADFSFTETDPTEANQLLEVTIVDLPTQGTIYYDADGAGGDDPVAISAGDTFTAADLNAGLLTYVPDLNENGPGYATFTYQVRDDGGTAHGGFDTDPVPNTITVNVTPVNDEPTVTATPANPVYVEDAAAADLFGTVVVSTVEAGQTLTSLTLTVTNVTDGAAEILSFDGSDVALTDGNVVTTATNGLSVSVSLSGTTATVSFSGASLSEAQAAALVDALSYRNTSQDPTDADRVVTITQLVDSGPSTAPDDNISTPGLASTVDVRPVNDEPTLAATPNDPTYVEGSIRVDLFGSVSASTVEAGQTITGMTLTVTNVTDGAFELLRFDGSNVALTNGNSVFTDVNSLTVTVSLVGTTATVTFSGASLTEAELATLVDTVAYFNGSQNPTDADRVVTITQLTDSGADLAPDDNVSVPNLVSTVNVEPVNDAPTSTLLANDSRTYVEGSAPVTLDVLGNATIADVDSADFGGGSLTLTFGASPLAEDNLLIINNANVTTAGNVVSVGGTPIGTFSGGSGGTDLVFAFNGSATPAAVQALVRTIGYSNSGGGTPTGGLRTIGWTFDDGDGNANGGTPTLSLNTKVSVIPTNDPPSGADTTVGIDEDETYHFSAADFAFSDPDGGTPGALRIETLPSHGILYFDPDGAGPTAPFEVNPGLSISWSQLPDLFYVPDPDRNGLDTFTFAVVDNGGAADTTPNTFTFDVAAVNDGPSVTITPPGGGFETDEQVAIDLQGRIAIDDIDSGAGTISVTLSVDYGIIEVDAGTSGADVADSGTGEVTLTGTLAEIQALLDGGTGSVTYTPDTDAPPASAELTVTIDDGGNTGDGGAVDDSDSATIAITAINDEPTLTATGTDPTFTEDGAAADLFGSVSASAVEPSQTLTSLTLTVTGVADGASEILSFDGSDVALTDGNGVTTATNGLTVNVSVAAGVATVTFSGAALSGAQLATLVDGLAYRNTSQDPTEGDRVVTITELVDSGANGAPDDNVSTPNIASTVDVVAVNDDAVVTGDTTGDVTEAGGVNNGTAGTPTASGDLDAADPDNTNDAWQAVAAGGATSGGYGSYELAADGNWTYTLDDSNTAVQALHGASTLTDTFTALTEDGTAQVVTITIHAQDDTAVVHPDAFTTDEATAVNGNVVSDNGSGADSDIDNPLVVAAVNGSGANVGTQITLASGALLTVNADGTFSYDPNHAFDTTPTAGSGASNQPAHDSFTYTLAGGETATVSLTITGLDSNDVLIGTAGADVLQGGVGSDVLIAGGDNDWLYGGAGAANELYGGAGNDTYVVEVAGDTMVELTGEGTDTVRTALSSYALLANVENLFFTGSGAFTGTGNELANVIVGGSGDDRLLGGAGAANELTGGAGNDVYVIETAGDTLVELAGEGIDQVRTALAAYSVEGAVNIENLTGTSDAGQTLIGNDANNVISGAGGDDQLFGRGGRDVIVGGAGNDYLAGGSGAANEVIGGTGNDIYLVEVAGDSLVEFANEGVDAVQTALAAYSLAAMLNFENLIGLSNAGQTLTGNAGNNVILAGGGDDQLFGDLGSDVLIASGGNDWLYGGAGAANELYGGAGNDTYVIEAVGDTLVEAAGEGTDTVRTALSSFALPANVENLIFTGSGAFTGTGNELANVIVGGSGDDRLSGGAGAANELIGGAGNDVYVVAVAGDSLVETAGGGTDTVETALSVYTLRAAEVENLTGTSAAGQTLVGSSGANTIVGAGGADLIDGGLGADLLIGNGGADSYLFDTALGGGNIDAIMGFVTASDRILLDHRVFAGMGLGQLNPGAFVIGSEAVGDSDRIVYDPTTGALYYDADGGGGGAAVQFATLLDHPPLSASDFLVI